MKKNSKLSRHNSVAELNQIEVYGARQHNLKNIDVEIPKKKLVIITGVSGSGKSSLAFDTVFSEGQRRYVESLSSYARQFLGQSEKAHFDTIRGLSPTIAIEQKAASKNPRSTVGTITEIYDYLRVLYARVGTQYCTKCKQKVGRGDSASMVEQIIKLPEKTKIILLAPLVDNRKGEHRELFESLVAEGYTRVRIDGVIHNLSDVISLEKNKKHKIEVIIDRLVVKHGRAFKTRLTDSVEAALKRGNGSLIVHVDGREDIPMDEARSCCNIAYPQLDPPLFSFNSPLGMCTECNGIGSVMTMDSRKVIPDDNLTIREGAIIPWKNYFDKDEKTKKSWAAARLIAMEEQWGIDLDIPFKKIPKAKRQLILNGSKTKKLDVSWKSGSMHGDYSSEYEGLLNSLMRRYRQTSSEVAKTYYAKFMSSHSCDACKGDRLNPNMLSVKIEKKSIIDVTQLSIKDAHNFLSKLKLKGNHKLIASELLKEIISRLNFLINVGLGYLSLNRNGPTLSGGEAQRIRLASQIGSELTGVLYVLDEPSIGLHQRDNLKLLKTLHHLRDIGNSLLVVEHDEETMQESDWIIDMGPGAGHLGGQVVAVGTPAAIKRNKHSLTGRFLSGKDSIEIPEERRIYNKKTPVVEIIGASANNLQNIDVKIPLGLFTCVTGVSGAGKSSLINQILFPALSRKLYDASTCEVGEHKEIKGLEHLDKVIDIDQKPIGRTPRSNPATYTKVFDHIRDFFALLPESRMRGYKKGRFSFNVKGGRCENCQGDGHIKVEMHFLADVYVPCEVCKGRRFNASTLEIKYKSYSIADVLELSVEEALELFSTHTKIKVILNTLMEVGLSYLKLGQPATTLSGGEAQRIKLARELAKRATGRTMYILDEPTTGLHFQDIKKLLSVLQQLVDAGNTVLVIEHNLDVVKTADWIIDLGPEGGAGGGKVCVTGSPEKVAKSKKSYTGQYLNKILEAR